MERQEFEHSWKEAFKDSEIIPSDQVWNNIELDLEKAKAAALRKRLVRTQWLAAASLIFSIGVGVSYFLSSKPTTDSSQIAQSRKPAVTAPLQDESRQSTVKQSTDLAHHENNAGAQTPSNELAESKNVHEGVANVDGTTNSGSRHPMASNGSAARKVDPETGVKDNALLTYSGDDEEPNLPVKTEVETDPTRELQEDAIVVTIAPKQARLVELRNPILPSWFQENADPVALMLAKLEKREQDIAGTKGSEQKKDKRSPEKLWSSVGFAAGSFTSVNSGASPSLANSATKNAYASSIANKETKAAGMAYSVGVNLGTRLTDHWVFQGGVNYLNQTSEYTQESLIQAPNFTSFRPASINELNQLAVGDVVDQKNAISSAPYDVNNSVRYLSVPLQAGYVLLNRGVGIQMNAGVATDLFLQNTVSATSDGEQVDPVKAGIGQNSAFRPVTFSGLMGTEVSYKVGNRYRIALNPGLRYPFNNIYKSNDYKASRMTFDIGLRFRYIFH